MERKSSESDNNGLDASNRGEYATAVAGFTEARLAWQQVGDTYAEADALMSLGVTHQRMGNLHDAEAAYQEALALFTKDGSIDGQAKSWAIWQCC